MGERPSPIPVLNCAVEESQDGHAGRWHWKSPCGAKQRNTQSVEIIVGEACFGCNLDAQQCPMHLPYKNALIGKYSKILVMVSYPVIARIACVYAFDVVCLK